MQQWSWVLAALFALASYFVVAIVAFFVGAFVTRQMLGHVELVATKKMDDVTLESRRVAVLPPSIVPVRAGWGGGV
jgi:hypothetical protein